ncbi:MAG: Glu-tRNAGln amidotransferase subunit, partial [Cyanobacteriota bacterium]
MKITDQTVDNLAKLSKLSFEGESKEAMRKDLENILEMCEKLKEVNTDGVEPLI